MLESASGSLTSYPGHPPAAYGGLVSLVPDLNSWPSEGARLRRAAAAWSKRYDPLPRHEVEGADGLGSLGQQTGTSEPLTGRASGRKPRKAKPLLTHRATLIVLTYKYYLALCACDVCVGVYGRARCAWRCGTSEILSHSVMIRCLLLMSLLAAEGEGEGQRGPLFTTFAPSWCTKKTSKTGVEDARVRGRRARAAAEHRDPT